jgi:integrase
VFGRVLKLKDESMKLTAKRVLRALKRPGRYPDGDNLYLQVATPGKGSWLLRYERQGRERLMGLGPLHTIGLSEARDRAKQARQLLLDDIDPLEQRKAAQTQRALAAARAMTFEQAARTWHQQHERSWKHPKHARQVLETLATYVFPKIGQLPVAEIDTGLVLKCLEPIWPDKTETASRVRARIEAVLDWATVRGYRSGDNPSRWRGHLDQVLPAPRKLAKIEHHPALPYSEIAAFIAELRSHEGVAAKALEFCILTATRTKEAIGAKWDEINVDEATWVIPEGRMKGGREHRVPLSERALELLAELPREPDNDHVFIGATGAGLSDVAMGRQLRRMGHNGVTVHGFRSSFRDWAAEVSHFPNHVVEQALAHAIGNAVEASYRRGDLFSKRKQLMAAWAAFCSKSQVNGDAKVVALPGRG